jgi:hypothetical protein
VKRLLNSRYSQLLEVAALFSLKPQIHSCKTAALAGSFHWMRTNVAQFRGEKPSAEASAYRCLPTTLYLMMVIII